MWRRIRLYLVGFGLGLIAVFFLLDREGGCNAGGYLPQGRVMAEINKYPLSYSERMECLLKCHDLQEWDLKYLLEHGEVLIKESKPRATPREYVVQANTDSGKKLKLRFQVLSAKPDSTTKLIEILKPYKGTACPCPDAE